MPSGVRDQQPLDLLGHQSHPQAHGPHPREGTRTASPALVAAAYNGALRPEQMSRKYLACARALLVAEVFGSIADNENVGLDDMFNETVGSVCCALTGRVCCSLSSIVSSVCCGLGGARPAPDAEFGAGSRP